MTTRQRLNVGLVGARRASAFAEALRANGATLQAVCDINAETLDEAAQRLGAPEKYADYEAMLDGSDLDAVVIGTPMPCHVPQSVMALERGLHVMSEVPAAVSIEECRDLVRACRNSTAVYMMAENYIYRRAIVLITELVRQGLFGETYYAEGEYLHELKQMNEDTPWRRKWQTGIDGITYGTHSLGPILQWMPGDRVVRVCCEGGGSHYTDPRGDHYHQESPVMLCKTARGALIEVRVDMVSDRPHTMNCYQLQGTDGVYESSRGGPPDRDRIWLRSLSEEMRWHDFEDLLDGGKLGERYLPADWRNPPPEALRAGHGGGDYFVVRDFIRAIEGACPCPVGIHQAMDMTLPGLVSQQSIARGSAWLDVPDSRTWGDAPSLPQLHMIWPERLLDSPPEPKLPPGYTLRTWRPGDRDQYLELMARAGFEGWDGERLDRSLRTVLPEGMYVIEHSASGRLVATAMAGHHPTDLHPWGGELGWVAGDPEHSGKGLGLAVCAAVTARFIRAGYRRIYLSTDDWRLPALKTYLKLGYEPLPYRDGMAERWTEVCRKLRWERPSAP